MDKIFLLVIISDEASKRGKFDNKNPFIYIKTKLKKNKLAVSSYIYIETRQDKTRLFYCQASGPLQHE